MKTLTELKQESMQIFNESIIPYLNVMFYWGRGINPEKQEQRLTVWSQLL